MSDQDEPAMPVEERASSGMLSRRGALKLLGVATVAGAAAWTIKDVDRAAALVRSIGNGGAATTFTPTFFTTTEWATVRVLVDDIIPRDERSGSATDARVPEFMDFMMNEETMSESTHTAIRGGLAWMDTQGMERFGKRYADGTPAERHALLDEIAWPSRATPEMQWGVTFFNRFRDLTASGFWSSEMGWKDLQYMGHTFVPTWDGCPEPTLQKLGVSYAAMDTRIPIPHVS